MKDDCSLKLLHKSGWNGSGKHSGKESEARHSKREQLSKRWREDQTALISLGYTPHFITLNHKRTKIKVKKWTISSSQVLNVSTGVIFKCQLNVYLLWLNSYSRQSVVTNEKTTTWVRQPLTCLWQTNVSPPPFCTSCWLDVWLVSEDTYRGNKKSSVFI